MNEEGMDRLLAALKDDEGEQTCARLDCDYPAPLGPYCALHTGMELRSRTGTLPGREEPPRQGQTRYAERGGKR